MKKIFAVILTLAMVISCSMVAFATQPVSIDIEYDNDKNQNPKHYTSDSSGTFIIPDVIPDKTSDTRIVGAKASGNVDVTINGNVCNDYWEEDLTYNSETGVEASGDAKVTVDGFVKNGANQSNGVGVTASDNAIVTVTGAIDGIETGVNASGSATVTANGENASNAIHGLSKYGVYIENSATVIANGNVNTKGYAAVQIADAGNGAKVKVNGNAVAEGDGAFAVQFFSKTVDSMVIISGDAIVSEDGYAVGIESDDAENIVIVEGTAKGNLWTAGGEIYVGELQGKIKKGEDKIFYLVGLNKESVALTDLIVSGSLIENKTEQDIEGLTDKNYWSTVNAANISGKEFSISSATGKDLKIDASKLPKGVTMTTNNGVITLKVDENFKGGLQDLLITINNVVIPTSGSGSTSVLYTGTTENPVSNGRWTQNADGTWSYATSRKFTSTWGCIANPNDANSAAWYYFDRNGNMLTGWQKLYWNGAYRWYYFSQTKDSNEGKCQLGGITPDGYKVGPDGAWIED